MAVNELMVNGKIEKVIGRDNFTYVFYLPSLVKGTSGQPISITIENDSNFLWQKTSFYCNSDNPNGSGTLQYNQTKPEMAVLFSDSSSGRRIFNRPTALSSIAGNGEFPFILPEPRLLVAKTTLQMELSNFSSTEDYSNIYINLIGTKLFME